MKNNERSMKIIHCNTRYYDRKMTDMYFAGELFTLDVKIIRKNGKLYCILKKNKGTIGYEKQLHVSDDSNIEINVLMESIQSEIKYDFENIKDKKNKQKANDKYKSIFKKDLFSETSISIEEFDEDYGLYNK